MMSVTLAPDGQLLRQLAQKKHVKNDLTSASLGGIFPRSSPLASLTRPREENISQRGAPDRSFPRDGHVPAHCPHLTHVLRRVSICAFIAVFSAIFVA